MREKEGGIRINVMRDMVPRIIGFFINNDYTCAWNSSDYYLNIKTLSELRHMYCKYDFSLNPLATNDIDFSINLF